MGSIVVSEFVSLDGVMEDPGGAEGSRHAARLPRPDEPQAQVRGLDDVAGRRRHVAQQFGGPGRRRSGRAS